MPSGSARLRVIGASARRCGSVDAAELDGSQRLVMVNSFIWTMFRKRAQRATPATED